MKRAMVIRMIGDPEISGALAAGIEAGTPERKNPEDDFHKRLNEDVRRVAMRQHTPEEWDELITKARQEHGKNPHHGKVIAALIGIIGLLILSIAEWYAYFDEWNRS